MKNKQETTELTDLHDVLKSRFNHGDNVYDHSKNPPCYEKFDIKIATKTKKGRNVWQIKSLGIFCDSNIEHIGLNPFHESELSNDQTIDNSYKGGEIIWI